VRLPAAIEPEQPRTRICMAAIVGPGCALPRSPEPRAVTDCTPVATGSTRFSELDELHLRAGELDHVAVAQVRRVARQL